MINKKVLPLNMSEHSGKSTKKSTISKYAPTLFLILVYIGLSSPLIAMYAIQFFGQHTELENRIAGELNFGNFNKSIRRAEIYCQSNTSSTDLCIVDYEFKDAKRISVDVEVEKGLLNDGFKVQFSREATRIVFGIVEQYIPSSIEFSSKTNLELVRGKDVVNWLNPTLDKLFSVANANPMVKKACEVYSAQS
jgi:hypothetical protein